MGLLGLVVLIVWLVVIAGVRSVIAVRGGGVAPLRRTVPRGSAQWWSRLLSAVGLGFAVAAPVADHLGDAYRRYAARVGRFVPGIGRLAP